MNQLYRKIEILTEFGAEAMIAGSIDKIITIQISKYQELIKNVENDLRFFESKYNMNSADCYRRFNAGELGDDADYFEWTGLYENYLLFSERIAKLKAEK